jgi:phosphosulfolactate synthase
MLTWEHPRDDRKTRKGRTIIMDFGPDYLGWTGTRGLADLLEAAGQFIDTAKIWVLNAVMLPDAYLKEAVRLYHAHEVEVFAGGLLFEYAYIKNDIDGLIARLNHLDLKGIEISENYVTLNDNQRLAFIEQFSRAGIMPVVEFGRKQPDVPLDLAVLETAVARATSSGAHHVIVEQGEFDLLERERPGDVQSLPAAKWFEQVYIEVDSDRFPKQHIDLIRRFGPMVNLANVAPGHVIRLEAFRRGLGRPLDYPFFKDLLK